MRAKKRIKVAHVAHRLDVGGLERVVINLIKTFPRDKWETSLYTLREGGQLVHELRKEGFAVHHLNKKDGVDYKLFFRIARLFRRERIDLVHCHNFGALLYGAVGSRLARTSGTIYTAHGLYSAGRLGKLRLPRLVPVDRVVVVSDSARDAMLAPGRMVPERVETLPNGIDTTLFGAKADSKKLRAELGLPWDAPVFGIVARLSPEKLHHVLLDAMVLLIQRLPKALLVVVGDGALRADLEQHAKQIGVTSSVSFLGERSDVHRLLQAFDVFVLSSETEGLSLTLLEAAAAGLPIVATDVGGNSEVVVDGHNGILVEPNNPQALAAAMERLAAEPKRARSMGELGRERVNELYSLDAMVKRYEAVYDGVLR